MATDVAVAALPGTLADLSLEELATIQITSASRRPEPLLSASASVFVISSEMIRRSGARTLPEALRLAPNLAVALVGSSQYAISARGFNATTANKLLVLIDGRAVYTPLYSGVFWDMQDVDLDEIERIEVLSGAGGTLWGANAVNGVISVRSKNAAATLGNRVTLHGGDQSRGLSYRHGGRAPMQGAYRLTAGFINEDQVARAGGASLEDGWRRARIGLRADWDVGSRKTFFDTRVTQGHFDLASGLAQHHRNAHALLRWSDETGPRSWRAQTYYDYTSRDVPQLYQEHLGVFDIEGQLRIDLDGSRSWTFGSGFRHAADRVAASNTLAFLPAQRDLRWGNLFARYETHLRPDLIASLGARAEYNSYSGLDILPSFRMGWTASDRSFVWMALSRAARAPSRIDREFYAPAAPPFQFAGGPDFQSEIADSLDLGFRGQPTASISYSLTAYVTDYRRLRSQSAGPDGARVLTNEQRARSHGLEYWGNWRISSTWRLDLGGNLLDKRFRGNPALGEEGRDPSAQWRLGGHWTGANGQRFDATLRRVGALPGTAVRSYHAVDLRYARPVGTRVELAASIRNAFDPGHAEFGSGAAANLVEVPRSAMLELRARF